MNQYKFDFSNGSFINLGSGLLKIIKEEMSEEDYNKEPYQHVDMTTLLMQGNIDNVGAVMTQLCIAADTADDTWLTRLKNSNGFDGLVERFEKEYYYLSDSKIQSLIISEYDEKAKGACQQACNALGFYEALHRMSRTGRGR